MSPSRSDSADIIPAAPLRERLDRMERDHAATAAKVTEIHVALLGKVDGGGVGLMARVDRHSRDLAAIEARESRRAGWIMTALIGWVVALGAAVIAWLREHRP